MTSDFAVLLRRHMGILGVSQAQFARDTNTDHSILSRVFKGQKPPPLPEPRRQTHNAADPVRAWANGLNLKDEDLDEFMRAAQRARAYSQSQARPELDQLNAELEAARGVLRFLVPLLDITDAVKDEILQAFDQPNTLNGFLAVRRIVKKER